jgi:hypothetical protein
MSNGRAFAAARDGANPTKTLGQFSTASFFLTSFCRIEYYAASFDVLPPERPARVKPSPPLTRVSLIEL